MIVRKGRAMKKKKGLFLGMLAAALAVVLAGCATGEIAVGGTAVSGGYDFRYKERPLPEDIDTLGEALAWIKKNAVNWGAYTVTLKANETIKAQHLSCNGKRVSITLTGDAKGREVGLGGTDSLFAVGQGVTLNIANLTLKGGGNSERASNSHALVRVEAGGVLRLKAGALITENYNGDGGGGGVQVGEKAVFIMEGGEIRGNTAKGGGGVNVNKGIFIMEGGTISGNTATQWGGGGLQASERSIFTIFTMEGGTTLVYTAVGGGGGVRVENSEKGSDSAFIMEGGTIYGNTVSLPAGTNARLANSAPSDESLAVDGTAKWGTGGTYTKGGIPQTGGSDIGNTNDTLIAVRGW